MSDSNYSLESRAVVSLVNRVVSTSDSEGRTDSGLESYDRQRGGPTTGGSCSAHGGKILVTGDDQRPQPADRRGSSKAGINASAITTGAIR